jgi:hypothetical protein
MSLPIFDLSLLSNNFTTCFNAVFIDQESYLKLLNVCDGYFGLNMTKRHRQLPCQLNSYMLLSREQKDLTKGLSKNVTLNVDRVLYRHGVLSALVQMKNNFTCNTVPHIILAKDPMLSNNAHASYIVNDDISQAEILYTPVKIKGKIGIIIDSSEEILQDVNYVDGLKVQSTNSIVTRPEAMYTVEQPPPPNNILSFAQFKKQSQLQRNKEDETMKFTLSKGKDEATGETYQGEQVMKGPRGGKYIMKDGKKKRIPKNIEEGRSSDVVYKINILRDQIDDSQ